MTKTITIEIKQFEDCSKELKDKILDKYRYINVEYHKWWDGEYDFWKEKLEKLGYEDIEIAFSGFSSQGNGASFVGKIDIFKWLESAGNPRYMRMQKLLNKGTIENTATIKRDRNSLYVHWNTTSIYFDWYQGYYPNIQKLTDEIEEAITKDHQSLNKEIYINLEKEYGHLISDESVSETLKINEYYFDESGKITQP